MNLCTAKWIVVLSLAHFGIAVSADLLSLGEELEENRDYDAAITEFKRFMFFHPGDDQTFRAYYGMGRCYRELKDWQKSFAAFQAALFSAPDEKTYGEISLSLADATFEAGKIEEGLLELDRITIGTQDQEAVRRAHFYKFIALVFRFHWKAAREAYAHYRSLLEDGRGSSSSRAIDSLLTSGETMKYLSPSHATWLSTFLPGLGQLYAGDLKNSLNALALNVSIAYLTYDVTLNRHYVEGALLFGSIFMRYYLGNRHHAGRLAAEENKRRNEMLAKEILRLSLSDLPESR
jgi:tetratricopeptide (TPR) repeat protein